MNGFIKSFKTLFLFAAACTFFVSPLFGQRGVARPKASVAFVDFRQLLLAHPLFREYDVAKKRFSNTSSAWVPNPEAAIKRYDDELETLQGNLAELKIEFNAMLAQKQQTDPKQLNEIFYKLSAIKLRCAALESAKAAAREPGNYMYGVSTSLNSLVPIINTITGDIKNACARLSLKYQLPIVDVSCFYNAEPNSAPDTLILYSNTHRAFYKGAADVKAMAKWVGELRKYLKTNCNQRFTSPFYQGAIDLRQEALSSMSFSSSGL